MAEGIPSGPWNLRMPVAYLIVALVPVVLLALAWKDWKLAAEEKNPIGLPGVITLAAQSVAVVALPALVVLTWFERTLDAHAAMNVVMIGLLFWLLQRSAPPSLRDKRVASLCPPVSSP